MEGVKECGGVIEIDLDDEDDAEWSSDPNRPKNQQQQQQQQQQHDDEGGVNINAVMTQDYLDSLDLVLRGCGNGDRASLAEEKGVFVLRKEVIEPASGGDNINNNNNGGENDEYFTCPTLNCRFSDVCKSRVASHVRMYHLRLRSNEVFKRLAAVRAHLSPVKSDSSSSSAGVNLSPDYLGQPQPQPSSKSSRKRKKSSFRFRQNASGQFMCPICRYVSHAHIGVIVHLRRTHNCPDPEELLGAAPEPEDPRKGGTKTWQSSFQDDDDDYVPESSPDEDEESFENKASSKVRAENVKRKVLLREMSE